MSSALRAFEAYRYNARRIKVNKMLPLPFSLKVLFLFEDNVFCSASVRGVSLERSQDQGEQEESWTSFAVKVLLVFQENVFCLSNVRGESLEPWTLFVVAT